MVWVHGIALGRLYLRTGGLLAPWFAHVFADLVIFFLLASPAR